MTSKGCSLEFQLWCRRYWSIDRTRPRAQTTGHVHRYHSKLI